MCKNSWSKPTSIHTRDPRRPEPIQSDGRLSVSCRFGFRKHCDELSTFFLYQVFSKSKYLFAIIYTRCFAILLFHTLFIELSTMKWWICNVEFKNMMVVWNIFIFPYIGNNNPNWLSYFSEGLKPPTGIYIYTWILGDMVTRTID